MRLLACSLHALPGPKQSHQQHHAPRGASMHHRCCLSGIPCRDLKALIKLLMLLTQRDILDFGGDDSTANPDIAQVTTLGTQLW